VTGIVSSYVPIYCKSQLVSEVTPPHYVGKPGAINQTFITLGIFIQSVIALLADRPGFEYFLCLAPDLFTLTSSLAMWTCLNYESPVYLWTSNQKEAALRTIRRLANEPEDSFKAPDWSMSEIKDTTTVSETEKKSQLIRKVLLRTMALSFMQQLTGINDILLLSPALINQLPSSLAQVMLKGCAVLFASLMILFIDCKVNLGCRRLTLLKVGAVGMFVCNLSVVSLWDQYFNMSYVSIAFLLFFEISIGPVMWLYISQLGTPRSMGVSTACNWLGLLIMSLVSLADNQVSRRVMYGVYCMSCIGIFVLAQFFLVETLKSDIHDIEHNLMPKRVPNSSLN
jgi:MFS family permease